MLLKKRKKQGLNEIREQVRGPRPQFSFCPRVFFALPYPEPSFCVQERGFKLGLVWIRAHSELCIGHLA
jgi:hypothetical protein